MCDFDSTYKISLFYTLYCNRLLRQHRLNFFLFIPLCFRWFSFTQPSVVINFRNDAQFPLDQQTPFADSNRILGKNFRSIRREQLISKYVVGPTKYFGSNLLSVRLVNFGSYKNITAKTTAVGALSSDGKQMGNMCFYFSD